MQTFLFRQEKQQEVGNGTKYERKLQNRTNKHHTMLKKNNTLQKLVDEMLTPERKTILELNTIRQLISLKTRNKTIYAPITLQVCS